MKFHEAAPLMKVGDVFKPNDDSWSPVKLNDENIFESSHGLKPFCKKYMLLEGEIVRAEPEVLSAEEWADMVESQIHPESSPGMYRCVRTHSFEHGHQNGRLEMWLEFEKYFNKETQGDSHDFYSAIQQLKPGAKCD